jgi:hypothetical protein
MSETSFWVYLRGILPKDGHYSRIEADTAHGFPDVHYTLEGVSGTIELKSTKSPKAKYPFAGKNGLRITQQRWIQEEDEAGGKVLLALQCGDTVYFINAALYYDDLAHMVLGDLRRCSNYVLKKATHRQDPLQHADLRTLLRGEL